MKHKVARRIALVVEYVGTAYAGVQLQAGAPTIQAELEPAIERLTGVCTRIKPAGAHGLEDHGFKGKTI